MRYLGVLGGVLVMAACWAGQMSSHDYTALKAKGALSGPAKAAVDAQESAYLAGAQGPDTTGVVQHILDKYSSAHSVGDETHYDARKHELALNLLDVAGTDPARLAYAIGWISHYVNDIHVHALVNTYGGFYEIAPEHHKELEMLESKYVLCAHPDVETFTRAHINYAKLPASIPTMLYAAYRRTYPTNDLYTSKDKAQLDYFITRFTEAAGLCYGTHREFYRSATYAPAEGKHRWTTPGIAFPNMPNFDDYEAFLHGIEITDVQAGKEKLTCTLKVHDSKLYGRFLADWEQTAAAAVAQTQSVFQSISAYLGAANPADKAAARARLLAAIPAVNLDQPLPLPNPQAALDPKVVFPGDRSYTAPLYTCTFTPLGDGAPVEVHGTATLKVLKTRWAGSADGEARLEIAVPAGLYPYTYTLQAATATRADFKVPEYHTRSWAQAAGSAGASGDGRVMVGEVVPVRITLNKHLAGLPGTRVWIVEYDFDETGDVHVAGSIRGVNTPFRVAREMCSLLPGAPDYRPGMLTGHQEVTVLDEQRTGNVLTANVQCHAPSPKHLGAVTLSCIFVDRPPYSAAEGAAAFKAWQAANNRAAPVYDLLEQKAAALSEAKKQQLIAQGEKYQADLRAQGLPEGEVEEKVEQYYFSLMTQLGVKLTKEQQALIDAERAAHRVSDLKCNTYYRVVGKLTLVPFRLALQKPAGWDDTGDAADGTRRALHKELVTKHTDNRTLMAASGTITITTDDRPDLDKTFAQTHAGETGTPLRVGPFHGTRYHSGGGRDEDGYTYSAADEVLLKSGGLYLRVSLRVYASGHRLRNNKDEVIADGSPAARAAADALTREAEAMLASLHLIPGQVPAKR